MVDAAEPKAAEQPSLVPPLLAAMAVAVVATFIPAAAANWARSSEPLGPFSWEWVNGGARALVAVIALAIIVRRRWTREAGMVGPFTWPQLRDPLTLTVIIGTLIPAIGLITTSWESIEGHLAGLWFYGWTGPFEELIFRGLLFVGLTKAWALHANGVRLAGIVSAAIFGLLHVAPIAVIITFAVGFAMTGLFVTTRSIWITAAAHSVYDILANLPLDDQGVTMGDKAYGSVLALPFFIAAAFFTWQLLTDTPTIERQPD